MAPWLDPDRPSPEDDDDDDPWAVDGQDSGDPFAGSVDVAQDPFPPAADPPEYAVGPAPPVGLGAGSSNPPPTPPFPAQDGAATYPTHGGPESYPPQGGPPTYPAHPRAHHRATHVPTLIVLVGGVIAAASIYLAFNEIRPFSTDPLGNSLILLGVSAFGLAVCTIGLMVAIRGVVVARPRHRPVVAILLATLFVPVLLGGAGTMGMNNAKRSMQDSGAAEMGRSLVSVLEFIEDEGVDLGPFSPDRLNQE